MLASDSRSRSPVNAPPGAPPASPSPAASHDSPGSSPNACAPVASAPTSPPSVAWCRCAALVGAGATSASSVSDLARGHERDVQRARARRARSAAPAATVRWRLRPRLRGRCAALSAPPGSRRRAPARPPGRPTAAARTWRCPSAQLRLGRVDHGAHARLGAEHDQLVDHRERVSAGGRLVGDALVAASRARPRARPASRRTSAPPPDRSCRARSRPDAPPAPNGHCALATPAPESGPAWSRLVSASVEPSAVKNSPAFSPSHGATSRPKSSVGEPGVCITPSRRVYGFCWPRQRVPGRERFVLEARRRAHHRAHVHGRVSRDDPGGVGVRAGRARSSRSPRARRRDARRGPGRRSLPRRPASGRARADRAWPSRGCGSRASGACVAVSPHRCPAPVTPLLDPHQPIVSATHDAPPGIARRIARIGRLGGLAGGAGPAAKAACGRAFRRSRRACGQGCGKKCAIRVALWGKVG